MPDYVPVPDGDERARSAAGVRLHAGGYQADHGADGGERRGGHRLDGRRHAARRALGPAAPALRLLPPALRAGHQPADRPDPRGDGDVAGVLHRPAAQHPRPRRERAQHAPHGEPADPQLRGHGEAAPRRGADARALPLRGALHVLPGGVGRRRHGGGARQALRRRGERGAGGGVNIIILSDRDVGADASPSPRCSPPATCTSTWCAPGCAPAPGSWWRRAPRARCTTSRCSPATAPRPSTRTSPSPPSPSSATSLPHGTPARRGVRALTSRPSPRGCSRSCRKMGISTYQSYCGAQIFEAVGLSSAFVDKYFTGTSSVVEGVGLEEIAEETVRLHRSAYGDAPLYRGALDAGGDYAYRIRGEAHMWTPESIAKLQHATRSGSYATYREYAKLINDQSERLMTLRGLFEIKDGAAPVPLDEVEPAGDRQALRHGRHVARLDLARGALHAGHRDEPHRRQIEHRRGRRGSGALRAAPQRRLDAIGHQAGGRGPLRRDRRVPGQRRRSPDQDGPGRQARRGRAAPRPQGLPVHRPDPPRGAGRGAHLAAAAPRHLLDRGSGAAHPRPQEREPEGAHQRQARGRDRRRHRRRGRGQGERRSRHHLRPRRRHRRLAALVDQVRRQPVGDRPRRGAADAGAEPPARAHRACRPTGR